MLFSLPVFSLLCLLSMVQTEVMPDFQQCLEYFYKAQVPSLGKPGSLAAHICQRFKNSYRFATLYDKQHRIPVYSAYTFQDGRGQTRPDKWFVEPQLASWPEKNMMSESQCPPQYKASLGQHQALDGDYDNLGGQFHRGHLNPFLHNIGASANATFTLTNAVPQAGGMNVGVWRVYERQLLNQFIELKCSKAYVVVGATASANNTISNKRVNVPDYLWNAWCCVDNNEKPIDRGAAVVENKNNVKVIRMCLNYLAKFLKCRYPYYQYIFHNNCT